MRHVYGQVGLAAMLLTCGAAWRWGGRLERRTAAVIAAAWVFTIAAQRVAGHAAPVAALATADAAVFGALLALSWGDREGWMIYAVACQGVALAVHAIRIWTPSMTAWTYLTALAVASYGLLLALAWGVWLHSRRARATA